MFESQEVVTRKPHRCWGCNRVLPGGTKMQRQVDDEAGTLHATYWCLTCVEVAGIDESYYGDGCGLGEVRENEPEEWEKVRAKMEAPAAT